MTTRAIIVPEITCEHCKTAIEGALNPLGGVERAVVDIAARRVTVDYDDAVIDPETLVEAIEEQGYEVPAQELRRR